MVFRKCPTHGWLATSEYVTDETGETVCPICLNNDSERDSAALHGYKEKPPNGTLKDAQLNPREKFTKETEMLPNDSDSKTESVSIELETENIGPLFGDE